MRAATSERHNVVYVLERAVWAVHTGRQPLRFPVGDKLGGGRPVCVGAVRAGATALASASGLVSKQRGHCLESSGAELGEG